MVVNAFTRALTRWLRFKRTLSRVAAVAKRSTISDAHSSAHQDKDVRAGYAVHYWCCASLSAGCRCSLAMPHETS